MASDLPGPEDMPLDPDLIKTLASDSRRDILRLLRERRMTLTELAQRLELGKATVLEHLKKLQETGLILRREDERLWVYYELSPRGRRLVTPGRTRFYIVMAATAAGALLLGVALALAFTHSGPAPEGSPLLQGPHPVVAEGTQVVWPGLSPGVSVRLTQGSEPVNGTLFVGDAPFATGSDGVVALDAAALDALPLGNHTLTFLPSAGSARESVSGFLDVRDAQLAASPLQIPVGRDATVALALADPQAPLPATVTVDGQPIALGGEGLVSLRAAAAGDIHVQVGRLAPLALRAVPDYALTFTPDGAGNITLRVANAGGSPAPGLAVALDGAPLGTTSANGTLSFPAPAPGVGVLAVGPGYERALGFQGWNVSSAPPFVSLARTGGASFAAKVANPGASRVAFTVDALVDGRLAGSAPIELGPGGSADVSVPVRADIAGTHRGSLEVRAFVRAPVTFVNGTLVQDSPGASASTPGTATPPTATTMATATAASPAAGGSASEPSPSLPPTFFGSSSAVLAQLDIGPVTFATSAPAAATPTPAPKVPGAEVALVVAAVAALALLAQRRRR